ncbi:hypothetical protein [Paraburkholderia flagellata]|uniref:hypothetical protein n=1 Tax=Paraburkholderia flagellata TaxID=2883241 RepID=UPI001F319442|nr:hypothetical protein [Paraburkholderia flagellata]
MKEKHDEPSRKEERKRRSRSHRTGAGAAHARARIVIGARAPYLALDLGFFDA